MAMAKSGYTLQVIKAGQQGHVEMRWGHLAEVDTRAAAATIAQHIGRPSSAADPQEISLSLTNAASGISVELHHPASGESATPAFIEDELKKIVQIVDGYEAAEETHIVELRAVWRTKKNPRRSVDFLLLDGGRNASQRDQTLNRKFITSPSLTM